MSGIGRGRGDGSKQIGKENEESPMEVESSSPDSGSEKVVRGRGSYRTTELNTIPSNIRAVRTPNTPNARELKAVANFVEVAPMKERIVYQYRVDFKPNIESSKLRRVAFREATQQILPHGVTFDGMYDARSSTAIPNDKFEAIVRVNDAEPTTVTVKRVGTVDFNSYEMLRLYNTNMKAHQRALGFFQVSQTGDYVHPELRTNLTDFQDLYMIRGFKTAVNIHEGGKILMNLEPVHKLMQSNNVLQLMMSLQGGPRMQENIKSALIGKLVVTAYKKIVYKVEDVNFNMNPRCSFVNDEGKEIVYKDYFRSRWDISIRDENQPLLLVVQNNRRRADREGGEKVKDIYLVPELCNMAGLTDVQRNDNRLKFSLIKASQVAPKDRVTHMRTFLQQLHSNREVQEALKKWNYTYDQEPVQLTAKQFAPEGVGVGRLAHQDPATWPKLDQMASFDSALMRDASLAVKPPLRKLAIFIARPDIRAEGQVLGELRKGFQKCQINPEQVKTIKIEEGDTPHHYLRYLREMDQSVDMSIVIMNRQNKERYDAIKKLMSVERGMASQVVTARLMTDPRKAGGAAVKIAIQIAAKLGGEPWFVNIPLQNAMICGYDTYHDTAKRGRSFGAFVATTNAKFSRWFSSADSHDRLEELSSQIALNMQTALQRYKSKNGCYPGRVFLYRDGVSEGQIEHVYTVELKKIKEELLTASKDIKFTMIIVNKRIGARFYMRAPGDRFENLPPGTVVDDVVTRKERYDFYLVSQATRAGTVTPTYYNIIYDDSTLPPYVHQAMAYKLSMLYYNWTGTVRVPAPCQYAHKLALLCGEHLHASPSSNLDDKLHFL